jgi:uroporphyrinogen decarboxylase
MAGLQELDPYEEYMNAVLAARGAGELEAQIDRANRAERHWISLKGVPGLFTSTSQQRGPEQLLLDFALNPEFVHRILEIKTACSVALYDKVLAEIGHKVDSVHFGDDLGTQKSTFLSPSMMREFLFPRYRRIFDVVHSHGVRVFMHCCGAIRAIIPDLIECGVDILNPIQLGADGMDARELKATFGKQVTFCGGVDVQSTLPFGTVTDVEDEVRRLIDTLGYDGGYIICSSNIIQPDTPVQNVDAMFRTGREYRALQSRQGEGVERALTTELAMVS